MSYRDYKSKRPGVKKLNQYRKSWYHELNPKPYLGVMLFIFLGIVTYWSCQTHITKESKQSEPVKKLTPKRAIAKNKWQYIVIHHSATDWGSIERFARYHQQMYHNEGLLYHFVIGNGNGSNDGEIEKGERWQKQLSGGHVEARTDEYNKHGIGICLVGNFEEHPPTKNQMRALIFLVKKLMKDYHISADNVLTHRDLNQTQCPGRYFPSSSFYKAIGR